MKIKALAIAALFAASFNASAAYVKTGTVVKADAKNHTLVIVDSKTDEVIEYSNVPETIKVKVAGVNTLYNLSSLQAGEKVKLTFAKK